MEFVSHVSETDSIIKGTNQRTAPRFITSTPDDGDSPPNVGYYLHTQVASLPSDVSVVVRMVNGL